MAKDPVCKMDVDPDEAPAEFEWKDDVYFFCGPGCKKKFEKDPEKYV